jgi:hypothetical protein
MAAKLAVAGHGGANDGSRVRGDPMAVELLDGFAYGWAETIDDEE